MRLFSIICLTILLSLSSIAQDTIIRPKLILKYNFTSILDPSSPYIQLSAEYPVANIISFEHELGYTHNRLEIFGREQDFAGIRTRNQMHIFIPENYKSVDYGIDLYLVGRYLIYPKKYYEYNRFGGQYQETISTSYQYTDIGFLIGSRILFYVKDSPICFELGSAAGMKRAYLRTTADIPDDAELVNPVELLPNLFPPFNTNDLRYLIVLINLKMGFSF